MAFHQTWTHSRSLSTNTHFHSFTFLYFVSKPLFIFMLYVSVFVSGLNKVWVYVYVCVCLWFNNSICLNCIHHHRHLSIFMQFSERMFFCFFLIRSHYVSLPLPIFTLSIRGYIVPSPSIAQSVLTISIRQTFSAPAFNFAKCLCTRCHNHCNWNVHNTGWWVMQIKHWSNVVYVILSESDFSYFFLYEFRPCFSFSIYLLFISSGCIFTDKCHARFTVSSSTATITTYTNVWLEIVIYLDFVMMICKYLNVLANFVSQFLGFSFDCIWVNVAAATNKCTWDFSHLHSSQSHVSKIYLYIDKCLHLYPWINWIVACIAFHWILRLNWKSPLNLNLKLKLSGFNETNLSHLNLFIWINLLNWFWDVTRFNLKKVVPLFQFTFKSMKT